MADHEVIPIPDRSGSSGNQSVADSTQSFREAQPFSGLHIATTIDGLAATNSRAFGGDVSAAIIAAATRQIHQDHSDLKLDHRRLVERNESMRDELEAARTGNAVLAEKLRSDGRNRNLRNLAITVGTSLVATGIALSRADLDRYAFGAVVFGCLLLFLGWFSGSKEEKA